MKKFLLMLSLAIVLVCIFAISVSAVEIGGINYTLKKGEDGAENTASINGHKGKTLSVTDIVIPEYVEYEGEKYYVTSMSSSAFENTNITSVIFDKNSRITVISQWGFKGCANLTYMELHDGITTISSSAFEGDSKMKLASGILPKSLSTDIGSSAFKGCSSLGQSVLVFPAGVTEFKNDTGLQGVSVKTLVFQGKMTAVRLQYYSSITVYFAANSVNDLNGNYVTSFIDGGKPYYVYNRVEKVDGENYTVKADGTLTITAFTNNGANSSGNAKKDADGNGVAPVNASQDKFYFCSENKMVYLVRNNSIDGNWSSYFAAFDTVVGDTTYKRDPHLSGSASFEEGSCYAVYRCLCCNEITKEVLSKDAIGHEMGEMTSIDFVNGYFEKCQIIGNCVKCGLEFSGKDGDAIFESLGYSCAVFGNVKAMVQGYKINKEAISTYKKFSPNFEIGFVATANMGGEAFIPDLNSEAVIAREISLVNDYVDACIKGLTEETSLVKIVFCLYVKDNGKIYFLDEGKTKESVEGQSYSAVLEMENQ